ncbi:MAG: hypothetical protein ACO4B3_03600 [Planctomycetota bacterium]
MLGELLEEGALPPERVREFGRLIARESRRLHLRIEEILETARGEQDRTPSPARPSSWARSSRRPSASSGSGSRRTAGAWRSGGRAPPCTSRRTATPSAGSSRTSSRTR